MRASSACCCSSPTTTTTTASSRSIALLGKSSSKSSRQQQHQRRAFRRTTTFTRTTTRKATTIQSMSENDDDNNNSKKKNKNDMTLEERIASGEFTKDASTGPLRKVADSIKSALPGFKETESPIIKALILSLTKTQKKWKREADSQMPVASGDIREIAGQPVFVPLYKLFLAYGEQFVLAIGPKKFVVVSDNKVAKEILLHQAKSFSKGLLSEILDFVMGQGLIPANGEVWKIRRKIIVPALHRKYVASMVDMFGDCGLKGSAQLARAEIDGTSVEMENFYSRLALDIIGKAVFNYDFDSLKTDDPVIKAVYTVLREAEYRSVTFIPYWKVPPLSYLVPRQRACQEALVVVNDTLNVLIERCKKIVEESDDEFVEEYMNKEDPSILHFLIASGDDVTSKQLRDDLMTLLIAGHETTAAVLTWTTFLLAKHPEVKEKVFEEVDRVCGDRLPTVADMRELKYTSRVINESMRLYPQPPVLIRRAIEPVKLGGYDIAEGTDFFISVWNLHRNPRLWDKPEEFIPERFPVDGKAPDEYTEDFAYLPFGGGQRKCIGDQFAIFESIVTLAMIMRRFDFELDPKFHPDGECGMTTGATIHTTTGLHVKLKRRNKHGGEEMNGEYTASTKESLPVYKSLDELDDIDVASGDPHAGGSNGTQSGKLEDAAVSISVAEQIVEAEKTRAR